MIKKIMVFILLISCSISSFVFGEETEVLSLMDLINAYKNSEAYSYLTMDYKKTLDSLSDMSKQYVDLNDQLANSNALIDVYDKQFEVLLSSNDDKSNQNALSMNAIKKSYAALTRDQLQDSLVQMFVSGEMNSFNYQWTKDHEALNYLNDEKNFIKTIYDYRIKSIKQDVLNKELMLLKDDLVLLNEQLKRNIITKDKLENHNRLIAEKEHELSLSDLDLSSSYQAVKMSIDFDKEFKMSINLPTGLPEFMDKDTYEHKVVFFDKDYMTLKHKLEVFKAYEQMSSQTKSADTLAEKQNQLSYLKMKDMTVKSYEKMDANFDLKYLAYKQTYANAESAKSHYIISQMNYDKAKQSYDLGLISKKTLLKAEISYLNQSINLAERILQMY